MGMVKELEELTEQEQKAFTDLFRIFRDVEAQARERPEDAYWQGKKTAGTSPMARHD